MQGEGGRQDEVQKLEKVKMVFLGDQAVGKTSVINRLMYDNYDTQIAPTVGMDFVMKNIYKGDKTISHTTCGLVAKVP